MGRLLLRFSPPPQHIQAWDVGAVGEEQVGARLDGLGEHGVLVLHDRRIPGRRTNIDHIAVGPAGVFVVDAKRYRGATVEVQRSGGWFSPVSERLIIERRDRSHLVSGVRAQAEAVTVALGEIDVVCPVRPVLAFVDAVLPLLGQLEISGVHVVGPRAVAKLVRSPGVLTVDERTRIHRHLAKRLPAYQA